MSLRTTFMTTSVIPPPVVAVAGAAVLTGMPWAATMATKTASTTLLQVANVTAFALNCIAVSIPGRIDGQQDQQMRQGNLNPSSLTTDSSNTNATTPLNPTPTPTVTNTTTTYDNTYSPARGRTLVAPSGWAFAIWGPIYLGETIFVAAQFLPQSGLLAATILPQITVPFVAANLFQTLWCASFRPEYSKEWTTYISPAMLAGTAYALSQVHAVTCTLPMGTTPWWYLLPLTLHFGWTTAATLVNLNGSIAMKETTSNTVVTAAGHVSAVLATVLGVGLTLVRGDPIYGWTVAWALAACADGMAKRLQKNSLTITAGGGGRGGGGKAIGTITSRTLQAAAQVQRSLCWVGAGMCVASSGMTLISILG